MKLEHSRKRQGYFQLRGPRSRNSVCNVCVKIAPTVLRVPSVFVLLWGIGGLALVIIAHHQRALLPSNGKFENSQSAETALTLQFLFTLFPISHPRERYIKSTMGTAEVYQLPTSTTEEFSASGIRFRVTFAMSGSNGPHQRPL
jgi:hypothetical protein